MMMQQSGENLSEKLFSQVRKVQETSTISNSVDVLPTTEEEQDLMEGVSSPAWFRVLRRAFWIWGGADAIELEDAFSHMASAQSPRSRPERLDTVVGFVPGNWIYEFSQLGGDYMRQGRNLEDAGYQDAARTAYLRASRYYSIASYPHLRGDELAEQAQLQGNIAYREAGRLLPVPLKVLKIPFRSKEITGYLHLPTTDHPVPVVMVSGSIDTLQIDFIRLYEQYLAPSGIGMLTLDMPGIGYASQFPLVQDTSRLHQAALQYLRDEVPWVDNQRIGMVGMRLGGNVATRLAFLEPMHLKAIACIGPGVHQFFVDAELFNKSPSMLRASLANRLGEDARDWALLQPQCQIFSLKKQGLIGGSRTRVPILSIGHRRDFICPEADIRALASASHNGKAMVLDKLPVLEVYDVALRETCDWLKLHFNL